jgi:hypothetical protein
MKTGRGWTGILSDGSPCNWAEPIRSLAERSFGIAIKKSEITRVRIIRETDYRKLVKNQKP